MRKFILTSASILALGLLLYVPAAAAQGSAQGAPPSAAPAANAQSGAASPPAAGPFKDQKEKVSYALGMSLGENLKRQSMDVDTGAMVRGINDAIGGGKTLMTEDEVQATLMQVQTELRAKQQEKMRAASVANKKEGDDFLAANKSKPGIVALPSGLQYKIITQGTGPTPLASDTVVCNYRGTSINGTEFDSSAKSGHPASFQVGRVIRGWTEALQLMPTGSKWEIYIPSSLAYGERGAGPIGPNETLIFEVELISIEKPEIGKPATPPANPAPQKP
jgi:FKBP-type peptidyl-prolyl cis-trans isomerase